MTVKFNVFRLLILIVFAIALLTGCGGAGGGGETGGGDTAAPMLVAWSPEGGAASVPVGGPFTATFSEEMDPATLTSATFHLEGPSGPVGATVACSGMQAEINLSAPLDYGTEYTATITTGAKDLAGNPLALGWTWTFTTEQAPDLTPPTVSERTPAPEATGVAVGSAVTATFSEPLAPATVNGTTFTLTGPSGVVAGTVSYSGGVATFTPDAALSYSSTYTATLGTGLTDLAGNHLAAQVAWNFTTEPNPDVTPPTIISVSPAPGEFNVDPTTSIKITFSEPIVYPWTGQANNVNEVYGQSDEGPSDVTCTVSVNGNMLIFTPSAPLDPAKEYQVDLSVGLVKDEAGNEFQGVPTMHFCTGADNYAPVIAGSNTWGRVTVPVNYSFEVVFTEPLLPSSVNPSNFKLLKGDVPVSGTISHDGRKVTFTPDSPLEYSTWYELSPMFVQDMSGNPTHWYSLSILTEQAPDLASPNLTATYPSSAAVDVSIDAALFAWFNELLNPSTVNETTFTLAGPGGNVAGTAGFDGNNAFFIPNAPLVYGAEYTAILWTGITDRAGNHLGTPVSFSFTTSASADTSEPEISAINPTEGGEGVYVTTQISAQFTEEMDGATLKESTFTVSGPGGPVAGKVTYSALSATFTPDSPLACSATYTATVSQGATDLAGNPLAAQRSWSFTTEVPSKRVSLVNLAPDGALANHSSRYPAISGDGRYVAYISRASNLVDIDLNGDADDLFVTDRMSGKTTLASMNTAGGQPPSEKWFFNSSISDDGRYVVFETNADLDLTNDWPTPPDQWFSVYLRDLVAGTTREVPPPTSELKVSPSSVYGVISGDGSLIAYASYLREPEPGGETGDLVYYAQERATGATQAIGIIASSGQNGFNYGLEPPSLSRDGSKVAFGSVKSDLVPGDTNGMPDVFVRDMATGNIVRASVSSSGEEANGYSNTTSISADGRYVAFESDASNLVDGDTNSKTDVFLRDLQTGVTTRVSVRENGTEGGSFWETSVEPYVSENGRYVFFTSSIVDLVPDYAGHYGAFYMKDVQTGRITHLYNDNTYNRPARISADGRWVVFYAYEELVPGSDLNGAYNIFIIGPLH